MHITKNKGQMETTTLCYKCSTPIKNIIIIDGKPYGSECATHILGINQLPFWFKGGDWNDAKMLYEANAKEEVIKFNESKKITSKHWADFVRLSMAYKNARRRSNDWEMNFIWSIKDQAGFYTLVEEVCNFETMEEAELGWKSYMGSFPYLMTEIKGIAGLSDKQIQLLEKIENK